MTVIVEKNKTQQLTYEETDQEVVVHCDGFSFADLYVLATQTVNNGGSNVQISQSSLSKGKK